MRGKPAEPTWNTNYNALRTIALNLLDALFRSLNGIKSGNEVCRRVSRPRLRIVRIYHFLFLALRLPLFIAVSLNYCTYFAKLPSAFQFPFRPEHNWILRFLRENGGGCSHHEVGNVLFPVEGPERTEIPTSRQELQRLVIKFTTFFFYFCMFTLCASSLYLCSRDVGINIDLNKHWFWFVSQIVHRIFLREILRGYFTCTKCLMILRRTFNMDFTPKLFRSHYVQVVCNQLECNFYI